MTDQDRIIWKKVTDTVTPLGEMPRKDEAFFIAPIRDPDPHTYDLHGLTVQQAFSATRMFLDATTHGTVTIITGRSGQIRQEFSQWLDLNPTVRSYRIVNDGAFIIRL